MRLLLDTHALLWWWTNDSRLSSVARSAIADEANEVFVSAASAWEVAIKNRLGKLQEAPQAAQRFMELLQADGFTAMAVEFRHALYAGSYPHDHRDPFDRMLAAQSEMENLTLITCDAALASFACKRLW